MNADFPNSEIRILPPDEARKIAAGEVVDRPASLAREFIDNAVDAGALKIEVELEEGGIKKTEVRDNGCGMSRADLALAWQPHATSKIRSLSDLSTSRTLGFRGEALAAASAVSTLEIITSKDGHEGWRLQVDGAEPVLEPALRTRGTTVRAKGLFDAIPARKRFLKRDNAEAAFCRQIFIDKALAFPQVEFRFIVDGKLKIRLPAAAPAILEDIKQNDPENAASNGKKERFCAALLRESEAAFVHTLSALGDGFSVDIIAGGPELARPDRRSQYVFANGRRITDFSMQQALEYGLQGLFPNGVHPMGAIFINIDPKLADFNLHPAKKEARFSCHAEIHHAVSAVLRTFTHRFLREEAGVSRVDSGQWTVNSDRSGRKTSTNEDNKVSTYIADKNLSTVHAPTKLAIPLSTTKNLSTVHAPTKLAISLSTTPSGLHFHGYLFGLFLLVSRGECFYLIDQHAAHELILYNKALKGPIARQPLLVPIRFNADSEEDDRFLSAALPEFEKLGIVVKKAGDTWVIEELPALWRLSDGETVRELLSLREAGGNMMERWAATMACHAAIKDGTHLDGESALKLAERALSLDTQRCPHGRPIMSVITRNELLTAVKRL